MTEAYVELGEMCNSGEFNGKIGDDAIDAVIAHVEANKLAERRSTSSCVTG